MTDRETTGGLDLEAVRRAQEQHDLDLMVNLYAEDAVLRRIVRNSPQAHRLSLGARSGSQSTGGTSLAAA